jgi:acid phosphatase
VSPRPHHIFVVAEENTSYGSVVGNNRQMPYLNRLIAQGTLWSNYYANAHGSMLAYIETLSGQTFHCNGNNCGDSGSLTGPSLMDLMNAQGLSWKGYFDGLSRCGQLAPGSTNWILSPDSNGARNYYQRHTGFPWYAAGTATIAHCPEGPSGWWPMSQFSRDLANQSVGQFNWITPDGTSDGHDGSPEELDAFLQKWVPPLLASSYFQPGSDGILIVWWDEAELSDKRCGGPGGHNCGGRIPMLVLGPGVKAHNQDATSANHDSAARFIQEQLGFTPTLGKSVSVPDMRNTLSLAP